MPANLEALRSFRLDHIEYGYSRKDVILYSLGVGAGANPTDTADLAYVYEDGLRTLPTFGAILAYPGFWIREHPELGVDWRMALNGEQGITLFRPIPPEGKVVGRLRVEHLIDKGPGNDLLIQSIREIADGNTGEPICNVANTIVCRKSGVNISTASQSKRASPAMPERPADLACVQPTLTQAALIYRLSGDLNPLHVAPDVAKSAGYAKPILHGAATWGIVAHGLLKALCQSDDTLVRTYFARFTAPVYPGDTLTTQVWLLDPGVAAFRTEVVDRHAVVMDFGRFEFKPA